MIPILKDDIINDLYAQVPSNVIKFWYMRLSGYGGVVRTDESDNVVAIYLLINTFGLINSKFEWLKYIKSNEGYKLDSVYSKVNLYGKSIMSEYRYSPDEERTLLATYKYHMSDGEPLVNRILATQYKDGEESKYIYGGASPPPESVNKYVDAKPGYVTPFWVDSDENKHWGFINFIEKSNFKKIIDWQNNLFFQ